MHFIKNTEMQSQDFKAMYWSELLIVRTVTCYSKQSLNDKLANPLS